MPGTGSPAQAPPGYYLPKNKRRRARAQRKKNNKRKRELGGFLYPNDRSTS